jgi:hypothetical protein
MSDLPAIVISGLVSGSTYALLALGIVIIFRPTDTLNFAVGDIGTLAVLISQVGQLGRQGQTIAHHIWYNRLRIHCARLDQESTGCASPDHCPGRSHRRLQETEATAGLQGRVLQLLTHIRQFCAGVEARWTGARTHQIDFPNDPYQFRHTCAEVILRCTDQVLAQQEVRLHLADGLRTGHDHGRGPAPHRRPHHVGGPNEGALCHTQLRRGNRSPHLLPTTALEGEQRAAWGGACRSIDLDGDIGAERRSLTRASASDVDRVPYSHT